MLNAGVGYHRAIVRLDDVALQNVVAELELFGDAVGVLHRRAAAEPFDLADDDAAAGGRAGLRVLSGGGGNREPLDDMTRQARALRGHKVRRLVEIEVARDDHLVAVLAGDDQVGAGLLKVSTEQQLRIRNNDARGRTLRIERDMGVAGVRVT
jgi:hypothetical protein